MAPSSPQSGSSKTGVFLRCTWRLLAFICLILVLSFYVPVIAAESVNKLPLSPQWVYVLVLVAISAIVMVLDFFLRLSNLFIMHLLLTVLWMAAFGIFAKLFLTRSDKQRDEFEFTDLKKVHMKRVDTNKMKAGVWVLFATSFLWAIYAAYTTLKFIRSRHARKREGEHGEWYQMEPRSRN